jgi:hypothetical protein
MAKQAKRYVITHTRPMNGRSYTSKPLTVEEAVVYFGYTLECGASYAHERGNKKINRNPKNINSLLTNLNNASNNSARNGCGDYYKAQEVVGSLVDAETV